MFHDSELLYVEETKEVVMATNSTTTRTPSVTTRVFGEENPTPCTLVIVPGSVAIMYRAHYRIIVSGTALRVL
jgi:hypothetical protein